MQNREHLDEEIRELLDREAIRNVLYRYCRAVDRGDYDLMKLCYHADGTDDHGFFSGNGWEFADYVLPVLAQLELSIHSLSNPLIELAGDRAFVETQWSVIHRLARFGKFTDMWHQGRYLDEFEYRDGEWKILHRVTVADAERWIHTADMQRLVPDSNPNKVYRGRRGPNDPVYRIKQLHSLQRANFHLDDLWHVLIQVLRLPLAVVHLLGNLVQSRSSGGTITADARHAQGG